MLYNIAYLVSGDIAAGPGSVVASTNNQLLFFFIECDISCHPVFKYVVPVAFKVVYIQTGKVLKEGREYAVIYYMTDGRVFCLWVDLKKQRLAGANWFSFPADKGIWLNSEKRDFINKSLARSGAGFLSGHKSLQDIINNHSLDISDSGDSWWLRISPRGNHGSFVGFSLNKETGELGAPMSGH